MLIVSVGQIGGRQGTARVSDYWGNVADFSRCIEAGPESAWVENLETSW
jgi:hypothetical protein